MCSGSEAGSYLRLMDFVSLNSRLESNEEEEKGGPGACRDSSRDLQAVENPTIRLDGTNDVNIMS